MDFKKWLLEQSAFSGEIAGVPFRGPAFRNPLKQAVSGSIRATLSNLRRDMGPEGKFLGQGGLGVYDEKPAVNEVAERMVGYAPPNDPKGNTRDQRQQIYAAKKDLMQRLAVEHPQLFSLIQQKQVTTKVVGFDDTYNVAPDLDPNAEKHQAEGDIAVIFKFVKRGQR